MSREPVSGGVVFPLDGPGDVADGGMPGKQELVAPSVSSREERWYKDAVIYEVHVRAFFDADADGSGDFRGLTQKLDYLQDLGVTAIWLLPFYPSPLKDDGYDIADYTSVNPDYGTLRDARTLIREAHRRGLRVITELVCNHTSDQHPWFQRARRAPLGSVWRDFYVWSDDPDRYRDARIIFKDFETSNWSWDPVANAYYWHRFYSHQPDLNFDSPRVRRAIIQTMDFWLDMGVDGLRLDAVPYLYEREGTNCENLEETHQFLRDLRRHVDETYGDRMLLAEANQWPEESAAYFGHGTGDECHMAFHFPVMPRMFMAIRMEDRFPLLDIMAQTPAIPEDSQWAMFLRNHDELTLEMVTDEERDYMYRVYARDPQMRINLGIRRRLAPLLSNNRRRIELMMGLLFSLPGTPVLYYGDEIGMGDNVYLGDRNGVRTPMQWSGDRNAGFSTANRQRLFLPVITDPEYHYEAINVEAQQANPHSLLWWTKRLIALRRHHPAFGRGSLQFLYPANRKILAFVREYENERILVVANLSRYVQYAELDLGAYRGARPVEMFGGGEFPTVGDYPFFVTLGPHAFYWFSLESSPVAADRDAAGTVNTLAWGGDTPRIEDLVTGPAAGRLVRVLPAYLATRRWFRAKARRLKAVRIVDAISVPVGESTGSLLVIGVDYAEGEPDTYLLPLAIAAGEDAERVAREHPHAVLARLQLVVEDEAQDWRRPGDDREAGGGTSAIVYDAMVNREFATALLDAIAARRRFRGSNGQLVATPTRAFRSLRGGDRSRLDSLPLRREQSNTSMTFADRFVLKLFRRLEPGLNPDLEVGGALSAAGFAHSPAVAGSLEYQPTSGESMAVGILQGYVPNQGDVWSLTVDAVSAFLERAVTSNRTVALPAPSTAALLEYSTQLPPDAAGDMIGAYLDSAWLLGKRTAEMHATLADLTDPAFAPEPFTPMHQRALYQSMRNQTRLSLGLLEQSLEQLGEVDREMARRALALEGEFQRRLQAISHRRMQTSRIRCHGDYHAGQVLTTGRDFVIIDFEGEPGRPLSERRHKRSALTDVAGMLRSFHYAAYTALLHPRVGGSVRPEDMAALEPWVRWWYVWVAAAFLRGYRETADGSVFLPADAEELSVLLDAYLLHKAVYELAYELNNRPDWVTIPLRGILELAASAPA